MWKTVRLGDIAKLYQPKTITKKEMSDDGEYPVYGANGVIGRYNCYNHEDSQLVIGCRGSCGEVNVTQGKCWITGNAMVVQPKEFVAKDYLRYFLLQRHITNAVISGTAQPQITRNSLAPVEIALPPLAEQQRIVAKLDAAFAEIDRAIEIATSCLENTKAIINSTLNELFIAEGKQWSVVPLADTCIIERGSSPRPIKQFLTEDEGVNWIKIGDTDKDGKYVRGTKEKITFEGAKKSRSVRKGDFILTNSMSYGRPYIMDIDGCIHDGWFALRLNENLDAEYYYYLLASPYVQNQFHTLAAGAVVKNISSDLVKRAVLPMPPLARQIEIRNRILAIEAHTEEAANCHRAKIQQLSHLKSAILAQELQPPKTEAA